MTKKQAGVILQPAQLTIKAAFLRTALANI